MASGGINTAMAKKIGHVHLNNGFSRSQKNSPMQACVQATGQ